jgi:hypothetical protein
MKTVVLMGFVLSRITLGLFWWLLFMQWQRKQQGDIIYVDRICKWRNQRKTKAKTKLWIGIQKKKLCQNPQNTNKTQFSKWNTKHICNELCRSYFYIAHTDDTDYMHWTVATSCFCAWQSNFIFMNFGEGIAGQVAKVDLQTYIRDIPEGYP